MKIAVSEHGAIVIEAMIAAAIVAAMLGAAFEATQSTARQSRLVEARREAMLVAQSAMATVGVEIAVVPGRTDGGSGTLLWRVEIAAAAAGGDSSAGVLDTVTVTVRSADAADAAAPLATLRSLRLGR